MVARVVVLDYGSGNVRSAVRMLERVGASVELSSDHRTVLSADGLFVPGVGNFHACMRGLRAVDGPRLAGAETKMAWGRGRALPSGVPRRSSRTWRPPRQAARQRQATPPSHLR